MNKVVIGVVTLIVVIGMGLLAFSSNNSDTDNSSQSSQTKTSSTTVSKAEVASHGTEADCWTYVNDKVYDITQYIPRHPGGDAILQACGGDGTSLFEQRMTDSGEKVGSGTPHSSNATKQLEDYLVGDLGD